jgi:hypothetical protein
MSGGVAEVVEELVEWQPEEEEKEWEEELLLEVLEE